MNERVDGELLLVKDAPGQPLGERVVCLFVCFVLFFRFVSLREARPTFQSPADRSSVLGLIRHSIHVE